MELETPRIAPKSFEYGWIASALLLFFLSLVPLLLPMADAVPKPAKPDDRPITARRHDRVVLMIVDGLGYRKAVKSGLMPHLEARIGMSAFGMALASFPTITPTGLRAIMSGHRMASEPQMPTGMKTTPELDSILARATAAGLKSFVVGQFTWPPLFPNLHGAAFTAIPYKGPSLKYEYGKRSMIANYDDDVLTQAQPILEGKKGPWDLAVLHLFETDSIGHAAGTEDILYKEHLPWLDRKIEEMTRSIQEDQPTTFLLLADHGQAFDGAHGGLSDVEREVPFMLWGADIRPGNLGTFPLYNAAPTVCALLGVPPPALTEGEPMIAAIQTTPRQKAEILADLARQRFGRWLTVKAILPRLAADPHERLARIEASFKSQKYEAAAAAAGATVRSIDNAIDDALPDKWLWRLIAALWAVVLAACCGLSWRVVEIKTKAVTALLSVSCLALLTFPVLQPNLWAWASGLVLLGCAGILVLTLIPAYDHLSRSGLGNFDRAMWWLSLLGIAFQNVVDIPLWSWLVLVGLFVGRVMHLTKGNRLTTVLSLIAVAACALAASGKPSGETSWLRSHLPAHWPALAHQHWGATSMVLLLSALVAGYFPFVRFNDSPRPWRTYAFAMMPLLAASVIMLWKPTAEPWTWAVCLASLLALTAVKPSAEIRGMWLSVICLAYYRTMADDREWCLLALAVTVGWCLAWKSRDAHPLWEGLGLLGIGLWSFSLSGGRLSFSSITVAEGQRVLGEGWHPYALLALLTLKPLAAIGAPIMPRLAARSLYSTLGVVTLLGALSAGDLSLLWWNRFMRGAGMKFTDDSRYTQTIFVLVLAWGILGLWGLVRGIGWVSALLDRFKPRPDRSAS